LVKLTAEEQAEAESRARGGVIDVEPHDIHLPSPSYYPLVLAAGLPCLGYAAVFNEILWLIPGLVLLLFGIFAWGLEPSVEEA